MDLEQLRRDGFTVAERTVPLELSAALLAVVSEIAGLDLQDRRTWFDTHAIVPLWGHQAQWDLRQHPGVHRAFACAYGSGRLWVTQDRVGIKPPIDAAQRVEHAEGLALHWDIDPASPPGGQLYAGLIYLTGTAPEQGAFCCLPSVFHDLDDVLREHADPDQALHGRDAEIVPVPGAAGDLVLWDARLPHGNAPNRDPTARIVQYISMFKPGAWGDRAEDHIALWREGRVNPFWRHLPGHDRIQPWPPAKLTELGRRLVGLEPYP